LRAGIFGGSRKKSLLPTGFNPAAAVKVLLNAANDMKKQL